MRVSASWRLQIDLLLALVQAFLLERRDRLVCRQNALRCLLGGKLSGKCLLASRLICSRQRLGGLGLLLLLLQFA